MPVDAQQPRRSGAATLPPGGSERDGPTLGGEGEARGRIASTSVTAGRYKSVAISALLHSQCIKRL